MSASISETVPADQRVRWAYLLDYLARAEGQSVAKKAALKALNHEAARTTYGLGEPANAAALLLEATFFDLIAAKLVSFESAGKDGHYTLTEAGQAAQAELGPPLPLQPTAKELAAREKARLAAEKQAEKDRIAAEKQAAKEQAAAEKARLATEKQAEKERAAAEKKRLADEKQAAKEQAAAEKARLAEQARLQKAQAAEAKRLAAEEAKRAKAEAAEQAKRAQATAAQAEVRANYLAEHAAHHAQHEQAVLFSALTPDDAAVAKKTVETALKGVGLAPAVFAVVVPMYAEKGWLIVAGPDKTPTCQLTPAGLAHLAGLDFPDAPLKPAPTSAQLNKLLHAARNLGTARPSAPPEAAAAILEAIRRETAAGKIARIPAIRQAVPLDKEMFDTTILHLHHDQKVRLMAVSDRRAYPAEELAAGIHSHGNIYFFAEIAP